MFTIFNKIILSYRYVRGTNENPQAIKNKFLKKSKFKDNAIRTTQKVMYLLISA